MRVKVSIVWSLYCLCVVSSLMSALPASTSDHDASRPVDFIYDQDPITGFRMIYPAEGAVEVVPVEFRVEIGVESLEKYNAYITDKILCVEVIGESKLEKCSSLTNPSVVFDTLPMGNYTAQAFVAARNSVNRFYQTEESSFSVVSEEILAARTAALVKMDREKTGLHEEVSLLEWANQDVKETKGHVGDSLSSLHNRSETHLVIGMKTAVMENFKLRQAIRQTWASTDVLPHDAKVFFIGCVPQLDALETEERNEIQKAIMMEKQTYGDLLTDELDCEDSYADLTNKVKQFMRFVVHSYPQTPFVMIADDDIYLRADRLVADLRKEARVQRLYLGQVWDNLLARKQAPVRDVTKRYYVSEDTYPLDWYPPFAFGPHYLLSMDCARFIAKNSERLRGIGAVDDVSVALWLLTIQVHVEHTTAFSSLRLQDCKNGFVSLADLSPFSIRSIHANIAANRDACYGFNRVAWTKDESYFQVVHQKYTNYWDIQTYVHDLNVSQYLEVTSIITFHGKTSFEVTYFPSAESLLSYSSRVCATIETLMSASEHDLGACYAIVQAKLRERLQLVEASKFVDGGHLELWRHNLFAADPEASPLIIAYATNAGFSSMVLECLFAAIYKHYRRPVLVMPEWILQAHYERTPDVFVFSLFDADCDPMSNPLCHEAVANYITKYGFDGVDLESNANRVIMLAGEPTDTTGLDERVILMSSVSDVDHKKHIYLNVASTSFGERLDHLPTALLFAAINSSEQERRFCAYLYARCDRPQREYMFDLLNAMETVDALGVCAGSSRLPDRSYVNSRYSTWYNDEAVSTFKHYKFVIAFENSGVPGYVTEKLVNPLLAGSIPIYLGNSTTVSELFNPDSFIDCGLFNKLRDCATYVMKIHRSPELYWQMRREPPIRNVTAFNEAFSWHPSVPSRAMADKLIKLLHVQG
ncbi:unnamed protein product [Phytophthora lilii]|uniref:Fucosyltransferase n=1 Tax=Phytophthora lilii TaxID=2077276 RepID=A0A9W6U7B0_9STRA|nr:unnamed protein product [Phytophthora lilii]